ncbi:MAG: K(+)-transporting ATPase subunit C [Solirubrobacterales bacterium]
MNVGRDLRASIVAVVAFTALLGLAYPLGMTGISQVLFPGSADGSRIERDGTLVGSKLIGQDFTKRIPNPAKKGPDFVRVPDRRYFQSRPSATGYSGDVTYFNNLGPNNADLAKFMKDQLTEYLRTERPYVPGLERDDIPVDAVTTSASGVDPHISQANARIQAHRIAAVRGIPLEGVEKLIDESTDGRGLGFLGEPGVNVLELNIALDDASDEEGGPR